VRRHEPRLRAARLNADTGRLRPLAGRDADSQRPDYRLAMRTSALAGALGRTAAARRALTCSGAANQRCTSTRIRHTRAEKYKTRRGGPGRAQITRLRDQCHHSPRPSTHKPEYFVRAATSFAVAKFQSRRRRKRLPRTCECREKISSDLPAAGANRCLLSAVKQT
jgi:hypothetical protein